MHDSIPEKYDEALTRLLLDELDAAERAELENFLEENPDARALLEERRETLDLLRAVSPGGVSPGGVSQGGVSLGGATGGVGELRLSSAARGAILAAAAGPAVPMVDPAPPPIEDLRARGSLSAYSGLAAAFLLFAVGMMLLPERRESGLELAYEANLDSGVIAGEERDFHSAPPLQEGGEPKTLSARTLNPHGRDVRAKPDVLTARGARDLRSTPGSGTEEAARALDAQREAAVDAFSWDLHSRTSLAQQLEGVHGAGPNPILTGGWAADPQEATGYGIGVSYDTNTLALTRAAPDSTEIGGYHADGGGVVIPQPDPLASEMAALVLAPGTPGPGSTPLGVTQTPTGVGSGGRDTTITDAFGTSGLSAGDRPILGEVFSLGERQLPAGRLARVEELEGKSRGGGDAPQNIEVIYREQSVAADGLYKFGTQWDEPQGELQVGGGAAPAGDASVAWDFDSTYADSSDELLGKLPVELRDEIRKDLGLGENDAALRELDAETITRYREVITEHLAKRRRAQDEARVTAILQSLRRREGESPDSMYFRFWGDNPFVRADLDALSTFGIDVDTASHSLVRNYLRNGNLPPRAAVRTEEFVNAYASELAPPSEKDLALHLELASSEFSHREGVVLLKVGVKAREVSAEARKPIALTIVLDVSGSMERENRLELVKQAILTLLPELDGRDTIGIVAFNTTGRIVLEPVSALDVDAIGAALRGLAAGGSTNAQQGLDLGYAMAEQQFRAEASNRVALFSDGVANTGITDVESLLERTAEARSRGIYFNSFGCGMGNHNDTLLEQLADRGDGVCAYLDTLKEAQKHFRRNLAGTFQAVARDAKIQVEFHPSAVIRYRQIGYENRAIADHDFRNDAIDAGEVGAGHEVVALYEIDLAPNADGPLVTARVRYQSVDRDEVVEIEESASTGQVVDFYGATARFRLSAVAAAFAEVLRDSSWARKTTLAEIDEVAQSLLTLDTPQDDAVAELIAMVRQSKSLVEARVRSEFSQLLDEVKRNHHLRARIEDRLREQLEESGLKIRLGPYEGPMRDELDHLRGANEALEKRLRELIIG